MMNELISLVRSVYSTEEFIPLHAPRFEGNERQYVLETLESTFVSSVGKYVDEFERQIGAYTGCRRAVATVNGTAALHTALLASGVSSGDYVITQALTFVATCNAMHHMGAEPILLDVSLETMGLCPQALRSYLESEAFLDDDGDCRHTGTGKRIKAVVLMHTFGHPVHLTEIAEVCANWNLVLVEDAAESLGSFYRGRHTGTVGRFGALSFNGNKIITTGGGGMVMCDNEADGKRVKHLTTTAKVPHPYEYVHDEAGFNYRLPNINSALGCAQMEQLDGYLYAKRELAKIYQQELAGSDLQFVCEPSFAQSNYWLNAVLCQDQAHRDRLLEVSNAAGVMTRPVWRLMHRLPMYQTALRDDLVNAEMLESRLVNIPSSPPPRFLQSYSADAS